MLAAYCMADGGHESDARIALRIFKMGRHFRGRDLRNFS